MDINKVSDNLRKNNMNAVFAENRDRAKELVKEMLFVDASITTGG